MPNFCTCVNQSQHIDIFHWENFDTSTLSSSYCWVTNTVPWLFERAYDTQIIEHRIWNCLVLGFSYWRISAHPFKKNKGGNFLHPPLLTGGIRGEMVGLGNVFTGSVLSGLLYKSVYVWRSVEEKLKCCPGWHSF